MDAGSSHIRSIVRLLVGLMAMLYVSLSPAFAAPSCGSISVTRKASDTIYIDTGISPTLQGFYVAYEITNNSTSYADLWVKLSSFTGGVVDLAPNEDGITHVGALANGASTTVYFYLTASGVGSNQIHSVDLYPSNPSLSTRDCAYEFTYSSAETIKAAANKVTSVSYSPTSPELGGTITMQVTGQTGTIGSTRAFAFSPATLPSWPATSFELIDTSISLTGGNTGSWNDTLFITPSNAADSDYVIDYTFKIKGAPTTSTAVYPVSYINSGGTNIKHTDTGSFASLPPIPIPIQSIQITSLSSTESSGDTCFTSGSGGTTTITAEVENSGTTDVTLDDFTITLPTLPDTVTYVSDSALFDGNVVSNPPTVSGENLTWTQAFVVPAGTTKTFQVTVAIPATDGTYTFYCAAHIDTIQVDATLDAGDNQPAEGFSCVGIPPTPTPTTTPTITPTATATETPTSTPTETATPTTTYTSTPTSTSTSTSTPTSTASPTTTPASTPSTPPSDIDFDNDGIPNSVEGTGDTDNDGIPDQYDLDSDNDGIPDIIEAGGTDADGDGQADSNTDSDGDGLVDEYDPDNGGTSQPTDDTDGDGIPDFQDIDSDNDGTPDLIEGGGTDTNGDGRADNLSDSDGDGLSDQFDSSPLPIPDTDGDGKPDFRDRDSDGDGIADFIEAQDDYVAPSGNDSDGDGLDDAYDPDTTGSKTSPPDTDGDGQPDFLDTDSDGDGSDDFDEAFDFDGDGIPDVTPSGTDADGNGIDDALDLFNTPSTLSNAWRDLSQGNTQCELLDLSAKKTNVTKARNALYTRAKGFASRVSKCGRARPARMVSQSLTYSKSIATSMKRCYSGNLYSCTTPICSVTDNSGDKTKMLKAAQKLGTSAKNIKRQAMSACPKQPEDPNKRDNRKRSDDYTNDLLAAIRALPGTVYQCE